MLAFKLNLRGLFYGNNSWRSSFTPSNLSIKREEKEYQSKRY
jgi:hypothetical protein